MEQDKYLVSDVYYVTLMITEYIVTPAPLKSIIEYTIKRGEQYNRTYLVADIIKTIEDMCKKKLLRKTVEGYEVY